MSDLKVGLLVGREWSFPPRFIEEVNRRGAGVTAELVTLGGTRMDEPCPYRVIVDRISHEVPNYRTYLKWAALQGATVINNPFMWTADDKFFEAGLATRLGIASPKTVALPNKDYIPGIVHEESLRNLAYPLPWQEIVEYIGMPCILKDAHGGGWKEVYVCRTMDELIEAYNSSGLLTMVVQEFIEWDHFVRCIALGQSEVLPMKYDPKERRYHVEHEHLTPELGSRIVNDSLTLMRALGYDMCSLEWAVKDGVPYAIDFMNPAPDMDVNSLTPHYFEWAVTRMADLVIRLAHEAPLQPDLGRGEYLIGRREGAPQSGASAPPAAASAPPAATPVAASTLEEEFGRALDDAFSGSAPALADAPPSDAVQEAVAIFVQDAPMAGEPGPDMVTDDRRAPKRGPRGAAKSAAKASGKTAEKLTARTAAPRRARRKDDAAEEGGEAGSEAGGAAPSDGQDG
jgi:hypothetical protein